MKITKFDPILNKVITLDVPITHQQYATINRRTNPIQDIVPELSESYREFLISGISPEGCALYELFNIEENIDQ